MNPVRSFAGIALLLLCAAGGAEFPEHHAASPGAAAVTQENLLTSERFWPYQVSLLRSWKPAGREQPLEPGATGVLIRVEASGDARIDFGRDGLYTVPLGETDLLERANRVRLGKLEKLAANFVLAIGPRLVDPAADALRPFPIAETARHPGFLTVFGSQEQLSEMAPALAPLNGRDGVLTIVLAQGSYPDARVREDLRRLGWTVPFVLDHLADAYTASLLPDGIAMPAVVLQTAEGHVLFQSTWGADLGARLRAAMDTAFGGPGPK